jgi:hypothetical protein
MVIRNKRGWIKIIESFTAIIIIMAVFLIVLNDQYTTNSNDTSDKIYDAETTILYSVVGDVAMKKEILNASTSEIRQDINSITPRAGVKIEEATPSYLKCTPRICEISWECDMIPDPNNPYSNNIYAQAITVRDSKNPDNARILKIFCEII